MGTWQVETGLTSEYCDLGQTRPPRKSVWDRVDLGSLDFPCPQWSSHRPRSPASGSGGWERSVSCSSKLKKHTQTLRQLVSTRSTPNALACRSICASCSSSHWDSLDIEIRNTKYKALWKRKRRGKTYSFSSAIIYIKGPESQCSFALSCSFQLFWQLSSIPSVHMIKLFECRSSSFCILLHQIMSPSLSLCHSTHACRRCSLSPSFSLLSLNIYE